MTITIIPDYIYKVAEILNQATQTDRHFVLSTLADDSIEYLYVLVNAATDVHYRFEINAERNKRKNAEKQN